MTDAQHPTPADGPTEPPQPPQPRGRRPLPKTTLALAGALVLGLGFVGGIGVSRATAEPSGTPVPHASVRAQGPGHAVVGTVERVEGDTVYVKTPDGETVPVTTDGGTGIRVSEPGSVTDLKEGSNVVVRGEKDDGKVTADAIDAGGDRPTRVGPSPTS